jgi:hypothetical protein
VGSGSVDTAKWELATILRAEKFRRAVSTNAGLSLRRLPEAVRVSRRLFPRLFPILWRDIGIGGVHHITVRVVERLDIGSIFVGGPSGILIRIDSEREAEQRSPAG